MNLQLAHETFVAESQDLLAEMESALLKLEKKPKNKDAITSIFRAAHTIKGSAGILGFDIIVEFTHVLESLLEEIRSGRIEIDNELIALLLLCSDHVASLLIQTANDNPSMDEETHSSGIELVQRLGSYFEVPELITEGDVVAEDEPGVSGHGENVASDAWHISLRFGPDVLRHGMDPLSFLRYLETLGNIANITSLWGEMPDAEKMDPESCYLGLEIDFRGDVDKPKLSGVFDFVRDDCKIRILPPHSNISEYIKLIKELPEDSLKLGELLVSVGSLTEYELMEGLRIQKEFKKQSGGSVPEKHRLGNILVNQGVVHNEIVDAALKKQEVVKERQVVESNFMRVHSGKLDELIALVGELVIAGSSSQLLAQHSGNTELIESASNLEMLVEQVRDSALRLRMVPISETFNRFNRVVHDLSRDMNKEIELIISGEDTELDKSMVDKIGDPLMHMVRNAIDHGIESTSVRQQNNKSELGRVYLNAYHDSGSVVIEVSDDGRGLNHNRIRQKAIEKGLITPDQHLSIQEINNLIMAPGFSTADSITNVSGRGIGMDVVKKNIEALRGTILIDSEEGAGTTFSMCLPLTLAIIDGFVVGVGESSYVVPLDAVVECLELTEEDRDQVSRHDYINLRDEVLPLLRLREMFQINSEAGRRENIVVVKYAGKQAGLVVDTLLGELQTVIKPLGRLFEQLTGISGSSILGDGEVALILDVPTLVQTIIERETNRIPGHHTRQSVLPQQH